MRTSFPAAFYRGGNSKGLFFAQQHLPLNRADWAPIFAAALGSPDGHGRQLNGMGGGSSPLSKVGVVGPSSVADADVDYTFAQVLVDRAEADYSGNCGNLLAAAGPFAVEAGFIKPADGEARVRIHNTNTGKRIHAHFGVTNGLPLEKGELVIPGVEGTGAAIRLDFLNPGGATTGRLLPSGVAVQVLEVPGLGGVPVSLVDASVACVLVPAAHFGLTGQETPQAIEANVALMVRLQTLRAHASVAMGIAPDVLAARKIAALPYLALLAPMADGSAAFSARVLASGRMHRELPLTATLCLAVAARIPGCIAHGLCSTGKPELRIAMPTGVVTVDAEVLAEAGGALRATRASFYRTARRLMDGRVYV